MRGVLMSGPVRTVEQLALADFSDGHHRVSVARVWGQEFIDVSVTEIDTVGPVETIMLKA